MIIISSALAAGAFWAGICLGRRWKDAEMRAEMKSLRDPETLQVVRMRKQMQQEQRAFNLLCNYGAEMAYGQTAAELPDEEVRA